ncbi:hypothetical protein C5Y96_14970 [Blastopirellula marina]|uniref:Uncharacterized protein n=1 Tax=Blastopirellula marina TaxID=124 RepID=A0A2S8FF11_9BACT|nr:MULTISPECIES: hypothetical protein [Pirellulaceae]PQO30758.1 hypothetical protein C5Y96_14970 [Blastopirellula marina]RCS50895.1 hypothetical protein DTL36_14980 [Bremerella cremea]
MPVKVSWYGERGIVNAVVAGLINAEVAGVIAFLNQVEWGGEPPHLEEITSVELIVEIGCGEFGDPDLIIICKSGEEVRLVTFVEAKVISYEVSAGSNQLGMRVKGYNSTINGQLSLKYRLAIALSQWNNPDDDLRESKEIYDAYHRPGARSGLGDTMQRARHLKKPTVLQMLHNAGLAQLPLEKFRFVAWTWDHQAFFCQNDFHDSDHRPLFLDQKGEEQWNNTRSLLGWIGFQQIAGLAPFIEPLGEEFHRAFATMRDTLQPAPIVIDDFEPIKTYNIKQNSSQSTIDQLQTLEELAEEYFSVIRGNGSYSITYAGKVILKLVPIKDAPEEYLLLGVSTSLGRNEWGGHILNGQKQIGVGKNAQAFFTINLPSTDEAFVIANDIIQDVAEVLGIKADGG